MQSKFPLYISGERIFSNSQKAINLQDRTKLGELKEGKVIYSVFEALYMLEAKKAEIINLKNNKKLSEASLISIFSKKDRDFHTKFIVFKYLKNKGYVVKTGLKFGEEFRVYCNPKKSSALSKSRDFEPIDNPPNKVTLNRGFSIYPTPNKGDTIKGIEYIKDFLACPPHAKWIVFPISSNEKIHPKELISKSRITHSTGKKLLLAIVDSEEDISFYEIDWVKP